MTPKNEDVEHGSHVTITINGQDVGIHRGRRTVAEIKVAGDVPAADELDQVVDGQLVELPDDGSLVIKGGEVFVSHPRTGGSA